MIPNELVDKDNLIIDGSRKCIRLCKKVILRIIFD